MTKRYCPFPFFLFLTILWCPLSTYSQNGMGSIKVTVQDFTLNKPIAGARILINPCNYTGSTNGNGESLFENVVPFRNYQLEVEAEGYIPGAAGFISVEAGKETASFIPLKQKSTINGFITMELLLGLLQWPLGNAQVKLQMIVDKSFVTVGETQTDFWGWYSFDNLDEGLYRITARAEGFSENHRDVEIEGGIHTIHNLSLKWQWLDELLQPFGSSNMHLEKPSLIQQLTDEGSGAPGSYTSCSSVPEHSTSFFSTPEAVPSVIPGPSELPYLYENQIFTTTPGSFTVTKGTSVYLRGFATDRELPSPAEFNPDAPCFDIYENKNGNFRASAFSYQWNLRDNHNEDYTFLFIPSSESENVSFTTPEFMNKGDYLIASLSVTNNQGISSQPLPLTITIAERVDDTQCAGCHLDTTTGYLSTTHARVGDGASCQDCHGPGSEHPENGTLTVSHWPGVCGQCHQEFAELQKANHSDPLPFGYYEPSEGRLTICYKCHYTNGYIGAVASGISFHTFRYNEDVLNEIPKDSPNISCTVCHSPHCAREDNPYGLRTGSAGTTCDTCHYEKWQNAILEGLAGSFGNAYHYPGEDYSSFMGASNPHRTKDKCVDCHMDATLAASDENGILRIGGHTFRMRDYGPDSLPDTEDDTLNITPCKRCHGNHITTFDINGVQNNVKELLATLSHLLRSNNHGFLPANEPGNCARCHKGGTVPFIYDPHEILEHAYTNYKLIVNDRSLGIHNPGYVKKLLQDSIDSIQNTYVPLTKQQKE